MIIKKFQAKTEADAVALAKKELGDSVVIMNVRVVKPTGLFKWFKSHMVEVTVAKEAETEQPQKIEPENIASAVASVNKLRALSDEAENTPKVDPALEKLDNIQLLLEQKLKKEEKAEVKKPEEDAPKEEPPAENKVMMDFMKLLYNTMVENEVQERYANQMLDEIEQNFNKDVEMEHILSHIYQKMILKFGKNESITPATGKGPKVVFFIGPTGVGKTTTLAKLASKLHLVDNKKVALFTADTYRIAATDQLKTYANIMGAPFHIIYTVEELLQNFENYSEYDYILVDTAGHSHKNEEQRKNMNEFIHALDEKAETETYLVVSATTKYSDLVNIADTYTEMTSYNLIFTKLDETSTYGNILNLRIHTGAPLSYVTCGQNVPEDIGQFDAQDTVKKLLGGKNA